MADGDLPAGGSRGQSALSLVEASGLDELSFVSPVETLGEIFTSFVHSHCDWATEERHGFAVKIWSTRRLITLWLAGEEGLNATWRAGEFFGCSKKTAGAKAGDGGREGDAKHETMKYWASDADCAWKHCSPRRTVQHFFFLHPDPFITRNGEGTWVKKKKKRARAISLSLHGRRHDGVFAIPPE